MFIVCFDECESKAYGLYKYLLLLYGTSLAQKFKKKKKKKLHRRKKKYNEFPKFYGLEKSILGGGILNFDIFEEVFEHSIFSIWVLESMFGADFANTLKYVNNL